jgi:hypothetical protein
MSLFLVMVFLFFSTKKTMTKKKGGIMARPVRHLCAPYKPPAQKIHDQKKKRDNGKTCEALMCPPYKPPAHGSVDICESVQASIVKSPSNARSRDLYAVTLCTCVGDLCTHGRQYSDFVQ